MTFNWLDIVLLAVLIITLILGVIKGLIRQVIGILAVIVGLIMAVYNYAYAAELFTRLSSNQTLRYLLGFFTVVVAILIVGWLVSYLFRKMMKGPLKFINHVMGGALGLLKGVLICGVIVLALLIFPEEKRALKESQLAPYCLQITRAMYYLIPQSLKEEFKRAYDDILGKGEKDVQRI